MRGCVDQKPEIDRTRTSYRHSSGNRCLDGRLSNSNELRNYRSVAFHTTLIIFAWWMIVAVCMAQTPVSVLFSNNSKPAVTVQTATISRPVDDPAFTDHEAFLNQKLEGFSAFEATATELSVKHSDDAFNADLFNNFAPGYGQNPLTEGMEKQASGHFGSIQTASFSQLFEDPSSYAPHQSGWQLLPDGLLYNTYLAGYKEPRIQWTNLYDTKEKQRLTEAVLGGRVGILRNGTYGAVNAEGFQLDLDGAVFARILPDAESTMLVGSDYRVGLMGTWRRGNLAAKTGYYHISSHVGDEYLIAHPTFNRINYVRDSLLFGMTCDIRSDLQVYGEIGVAPGTQGGAKTFEFQFGSQYTPKADRPSAGAPYLGFNTHLREEFNYNGSVNFVAGWGWMGPASRRRLRVGMQYYTGPSMQFEFFDKYENLLGGGVWFDY